MPALTFLPTSFSSSSSSTSHSTSSHSTSSHSTSSSHNSHATAWLQRINLSSSTTSIYPWTLATVCLIVFAVRLWQATARRTPTKEKPEKLETLSTSEKTQPQSPKQLASHSPRSPLPTPLSTQQQPLPQLHTALPALPHHTPLNTPFTRTRRIYHLGQPLQPQLAQHYFHPQLQLSPFPMHSMHKSRGISSVSADSRALNVGLNVDSFGSLHSLPALPALPSLDNMNDFNMSMPMSFLHQPNPDYGAEEVDTEAAAELEAAGAEADTAGSASSETTEASASTLSTSTSTSSESTSTNSPGTATATPTSPWGQHTQVYGGGVCLACLAAGDETAGYGDSVPLEERSRSRS